MPRGRRATGTATGAGRGRGGRRGRAAGAGDDGRLGDIVTRYVGDLVEAVRQEVRRSVADEVNAVLLSGGGGGRLLAGRTRRGGSLGRKRIVTCIAPGCQNPSKGPRFHYLCEKHKDAKKQDYEAWRKARKEKQAA